MSVAFNMNCGVSQIIEFLPDPTLAIDETGRVIFWNQAMEKLTGIASEDMLGQKDYAYAWPFYGERRPILIDMVLNPDEAFEKRYAAFTRSGDSIYAENIALPSGRFLWGKAGPIRDEHGQVIGAIESLRDITERKRMERAHLDALNTVEQLVNFLPDPTFAIDREGRIILWNKAIAGLTGIPAGRMLGKGDHEYALPFYGYRRLMMVDSILNPDLMRHGEQPYQYQDDGGLVFEGEVFSRITQQQRYITSHASPIHGPSGEMIGAIQTLRDITERKRVEQALMESEEKFRLLFEASADGNLIMEDGCYIDCNPAALRLAGLTDKSQLLGKRPMDFAPERQPDGLPSAEKSLEMIEIALERGFHHFEWVRRRADGTELLIDAMLTAIPVHGKKFLYLVWRDLSDRKRAEEAMRESEEQYRILFENATEGLFRSTTAGRFISVNPSLARIGGYSSPQEMIESVQDIGHELYAHPEERQTMLCLLAEQDKAEGVEVAYIRKDKRRVWISLNIHTVRDKKGHIQYYDGTCVDITERKRMEQALKESEEKFRLLFEASADGNFILEDGRVIDCNARALTIAGCTDKAQFMGARPEDFSPAVQPDGMPSTDKARQMQNTASSNGFHRFDWLCKRFDGSLAYIDVMLTALPMQGQQLLFTTWRDISDRKRAEEALRESEERYRTLFENATEGIFQSTPAGRFINVNPSLARMGGFPSPQALIETVQDICQDLYAHPEDRRTMMRILEEHDKIEGFEVEMLRMDRSRMWLSMNMHAVRGEKGEILYFDGTCVDISERKKAEERLRASEERYRLVAENIHDIIAVYDLDFAYTYVSPSIECITGYHPREIVGKPVMALIDGDSRKSLQDILDQIRELVDAHDSFLASRSWTAELNRIVKSGRSMWTESRISFLLDDQGKPLGLLSVTRDIDERKRAEAQMQFYREHLQRAQKLEAIGTLAGGIAHDFNNILSVIIGFSELIRDESTTAQRIREMIEEVLKAGERAKDLVHQILTFSRQVEVEAHPLGVHIIVKEALKLLRSTILSTITIVQDIDPAAGSILADPTQIHQVVMNLCTNAYQAMQDAGGTLRVTLEAVILGEAVSFTHPDLHAGDYVKLNVQDTGCGMDDATMQRIFEPFFTTKAKGIGTGLGLAITHGIVKKLGGAIIPSSTPGAGSTFEVFLPRFGIDAEHEECEVGTAPLGHGERILLVDDEPDIVTYTTIMLEGIGYAVRGFSSSREALASFSDDPCAYDLVITDQTMPELRGDQLAWAILALRPAIPIVLMTGYSTVMDAESALRLGIKEFIDKPFSRMTIARAVQRVLTNSGGS